jgi:hypothetical protein
MWTASGRDARVPYHALELWTWFTSIGETARLPGLVNGLLRA